jgi:hypothetical protein
MSDSSPAAGRPSFAQLDALSTDELRRRAFDAAERRHDVGFFWDLLTHLRPAESVAAEDGSAGHITGGIAEAVEAVREVLSGDLGDVEPLARARFIDYLRSAG